MKAKDWEKLRRLIGGYRHGKMSRSRFILEWKMARRELGLDGTYRAGRGTGDIP